jgi:hypothetical protein
MSTPETDNAPPEQRRFPQPPLQLLQLGREGAPEGPDLGLQVNPAKVRDLEALGRFVDGGK